MEVVALYDKLVGGLYIYIYKQYTHTLRFLLQHIYSTDIGWAELFLVWRQEESSQGYSLILP